MQQLTVAHTRITIVVSAPRSTVSGPLREAMTTLAISLAVLGLALVLAIVLQVRLGLRLLGLLRQAVADVRTGRSGRVPAEQPLEILPLVSELNLLLEQNAARSGGCMRAARFRRDGRQSAGKRVQMGTQQGRDSRAAR
jgi:hypothetical protein